MRLHQTHTRERYAFDSDANRMMPKWQANILFSFSRFYFSLWFREKKTWFNSRRKSITRHRISDKQLELRCKWATSLALSRFVRYRSKQIDIDRWTRESYAAQADAIGWWIRVYGPKTAKYDHHHRCRGPPSEENYPVAPCLSTC